MSRAVLLLTLVACTDSVVLTPVIDRPTDSDSAPSALDTVTVTVAHAGSADDLVSASFAGGQPLELTGVPFADDLVIHLSGQIGGSEIAYGRTCTFAQGYGADTGWLRVSVKHDPSRRWGFNSLPIHLSSNNCNSKLGPLRAAELRLSV